MKIAVYAIALNEQSFAERWAQSAQDADYRLVADTGSTDQTIVRLRTNAVTVVPIRVRPWRFDDARNAAMNLLPDVDVIIALDLDEVLNQGWRSIIEAYWTPQTTRLHYRYTWSWLADGQPDLTYYGDKVCGRYTHRWKSPVHEVLIPTVPEVITRVDALLIEHYPDPNKSRGQYLELLHQAVMEDPSDDRNAHYLARELMYHAQYPSAIAEFQRHLSLPKATWRTERASSMRYLGRCYEALHEFQTAYRWYIQATLEDDSFREALVEAARFALSRNLYYDAIALCKRAEAIPNSSATYMNERYAREEGVADLLAVALYHVGQLDTALHYAEQAVKLNRHDARLAANLAMIRGR